jgi:hypothetical protein
MASAITGGMRWQYAGQLHIAAAQLDAGQLQRLDHVAYLGQHAVGLAAFHEGADALDDLPGALRLVGRLFQRELHLVGQRAVFQAVSMPLL